MKASIILACLFLSPALFAGGTLYIPETAPFQKDLNIRGKIKDECNLERKVADEVAAKAHSAYDNVVREKPAGGKYHVLTMEITDVFGAGGGAWSGPKDMEIKGTLKDQSGKVIGSFVDRRFSTGGPMGGLKGTCKILQRITRAFGKDVGGFLISPSKGARLGDAR